MFDCPNCNNNQCSCTVMDDFIDDELVDLTELEASETIGSKRCLGCYFFNCRCKLGLEYK